MKKTAWYIIGTIVVITVFLFLLKTPLMKGAAKFLIQQDDFEYVETAFVLSGQSFDRGTGAYELLNSNRVGKVVCTGANKPPVLEVFGADLLESDLTKMRIDELSDSAYVVELLQEGTSTLEEADAILNYCLSHQIDTCVIVSSKFHTRRVAYAFKEQFEDAGVYLFIHGAPSSSYNEMEWWKSENGLIALNNEYVKLIYYWVK